MTKTAWIAAAALLALPVFGPAFGPAAAQTFDMSDPIVTAIQARAEAGDVEAMLDWAGVVNWAKPVPGAPTPDEAMMAWLERAAATGDGEALYVLSNTLRQGHNGITDPERAKALIRQAAEKGNGNAVVELDAGQEDGPYPEPKADGVERLRWDMGLLERPMSDHAMKTVVADMERLKQAGYGAHITYWRQHFEAFAIAAEHDNRFVFGLLGMQYLYGEGVAPDRVQAEHWLVRDAEKGNSDNLLQMAGRYEDGTFGPHREAEAKAYYARAAALLRADAADGAPYAKPRLDALVKAGKVSAVEAGAQ